MGVRLLPLTEEEYAVYRTESEQKYMEENVASGRWAPAEAAQRSAEEMGQILDQGFRTPDHFFRWIATDPEGERVGWIWYFRSSKTAVPELFVYDIEISGQFRRMGYATQTLQHLETVARELGVARISLHVFGRNRPARALYEKLGYAELSVLMRKDLTAPGAR